MRAASNWCWHSWTSWAWRAPAWWAIRLAGAWPGRWPPATPGASNGWCWWPQTGLPALRGFLALLSNVAKDWNHETLSLMPGFRDRIGLIQLTREEGGLNLTMPTERIERLTLYVLNEAIGRAAILQIRIQRYPPRLEPSTRTLPRSFASDAKLSPTRPHRPPKRR